MRLNAGLNTVSGAIFEWLLRAEPAHCAEKQIRLLSADFVEKVGDGADLLVFGLMSGALPEVMSGRRLTVPTCTLAFGETGGHGAQSYRSKRVSPTHAASPEIRCRFRGSGSDICA